MKGLAAIFGILLLLSCQGIHETKEPEDLIPQDKMVDVLTDIALIHGARSYNKDLMKEKGVNPDKFVFEKHGIDSLQYIRSNRYYSENYKEYQDIYARVKERLENLKTEYDTIRAREERKLDSLRTLDKEKDSIVPKKLRKLQDSLRIKRMKRRDSLIRPVSIKDSIR